MQAGGLRRQHKSGKSVDKRETHRKNISVDACSSGKERERDQRQKNADLDTFSDQIENGRNILCNASGSVGKQDCPDKCKQYENE